jgi:hypothetical protein
VRCVVQAIRPAGVNTTFNLVCTSSAAWTYLGLAAFLKKVAKWGTDLLRGKTRGAVVEAVAYRANKIWTMVIIDGTEPTVEKRSAPLSLAMQSLGPKGYERESFAGRQAHRLNFPVSTANGKHTSL